MGIDPETFEHRDIGYEENKRVKGKWCSGRSDSDISEMEFEEEGEERARERNKRLEKRRNRLEERERHKRLEEEEIEESDSDWEVDDGDEDEDDEGEEDEKDSYVLFGNGEDDRGEGLASGSQDGGTPTRLPVSNHRTKHLTRKRS